MRMGLCHFKSQHSSGTGNKPNTRAQAAVNSITAKINKFATRYRAARQALLSLAPEAFLADGCYVKTLQELLPTDIRNPRGEDLDDRVPLTPNERRMAVLGEGHRDVPWIWYTVRYTAQDRVDTGAATDEDAIECTLSLNPNIPCNGRTLRSVPLAMRSTYARAQARYLRWEEEVLFLREEMRRAPEFLLWKSKWWLAKAGGRDNVSEDLRSGLDGYAARQAAMFAGMAKHLVDQFRVIAKEYDFVVHWSTELLQVVDGELLSTSGAGHSAPQAGDLSRRGDPPAAPATEHASVMNLVVPKQSVTADVPDETVEGSSEEDEVNVGADTDGYDSEF